jgi:two-component system, chemotaxis family, sensor kinase CheA
MAFISDDNLTQEFVIEAKDHLAAIEPEFLILEKDLSQASGDIINKIFRAIHSIKGAAGFLGFEALKKLSHVMESVLMLVRDGKLELSSPMIDALLEGVDILNVMLDDIQSSETVEIDAAVATLNTLIPGAAPSSANTAATTPSSAPTLDKISSTSDLPFNPDSETLNKLVIQGQHVYSITVNLEKDLSQKNRTPLDFIDLVASMGMILDSVYDIDHFPTLDNFMEGVVHFKFMITSVLERELIAMGIDISPEQVDELDPTPYTANVVKATVTTPDEVPVKASAPAIEAQPEPMVSTEKKAATKPAGAAQKAPAADTNESVRVRIDLLNKLMDLAGEMVLSRNQLIRTIGDNIGKIPGLSTIIQNVDLITSDLQEHIMQTRMQPIGSVFGKFPRVIRDLAKQLGKEIELVTHGEDVELDKSIIESLSDPLTHLIRNCCDHAVETPAERIAAGKSGQGTVTLNAFHEGGQINITITDNGRGIDHERLAKKVVSAGIYSEQAVKAMSIQEIVNFIFLPGLSTAEKVSDVSGRGVGMDVVRTNIEKLGGHISVDTVLGKGTTILLRLPLTLAIIPSLIVGVGDQRLAMPQINLIELVCIRAHDIQEKIERIGKADVLRLRGKLLPLLRLADVMGLQRHYTDPETGDVLSDRRNRVADDRQPPMENRREDRHSDYYVLVLKVGPNQYGLIVDDVFDTEEIVVKPLSGFLKNCKCFAGATIMGDGRVAMILDAGGILAFTKLSFADIDADAHLQKAELDTGDHPNRLRQSVILFHNALDETFAIPLDSVLRLEKFETSKIERISGREFLTYRGKGLPLIRFESYLSVSPAPYDLQESYLIIPKSGNGVAGLIATKILDTLEVDVELEKTLLEQPGVKGSGVINGVLTLFIEPEGLLQTAGLLQHNYAGAY